MHYCIIALICLILDLVDGYTFIISSTVFHFMAHQQASVIYPTDILEASGERVICNDLVARHQPDAESQVPTPGFCVSRLNFYLTSTAQLTSLHRKNPGIAYALSRPWPPSLVQPGKRKQATIFFAFLMIFYVVFAVTLVILHVRQRLDPPVTFRRDEENYTRVPRFIFICSSDGYLSVSCNIDFNNDICDAVFTNHTEWEIWCTLVEFPGGKQCFRPLRRLLTIRIVAIFK